MKKTNIDTDALVSLVSETPKSAYELHRVYLNNGGNPTTTPDEIETVLSNLVNTGSIQSRKRLTLDWIGAEIMNVIEVVYYLKAKK